MQYSAKRAYCTAALSFLILFAIISPLLAHEDYYKLLGLKKDAREDEIKKAFRKMSRQYHPDKNPGNAEAERLYVEVNKAYQVLSDPEKRQVYDLQGEEGLKKHENPQTDMWGNQRGAKRGPNAHADMDVTLEDLYNGAVKEMAISRNILCPQCRGTGSKDGKMVKCPHCNGKGVRLQNMQMGTGFSIQMQVPCDQCGGTGQRSEANCPTCRGRRVVANKKTLRVEIERGMPDGHEIVFERESEQSPDFIPGDVVFKLRQQQHHRFRRDGNDLHMDLPLTLKESILGFKKKVKHLDDHYTEIGSKEVIQPFQVRKSEGEGMPHHNYPSQMGDLYTKFIVSLPRRLSNDDKELLKQIFALSS